MRTRNSLDLLTATRPTSDELASATNRVLLVFRECPTDLLPGVMEILQPSENDPARNIKDALLTLGLNAAVEAYMDSQGNDDWADPPFAEKQP